MTAVLVDLAAPAANGATEPAKGTIYASPTTRRRDGTHVVIAAPLAQVLVNGVTTLQLYPGVWKIVESIPRGGGITRTVTVPSSGATINYGDLADA